MHRGHREEFGQIVGRTSAPGDEAVVEDRHRLLNRLGRTQSGQGLQRHFEAGRGCHPQFRVGHAVTGGGDPERIARSGPRACYLGQRFDGAVHGLGSLRVVEQGGGDGERNEPSVVTELCVDHA